MIIIDTYDRQNDRLTLYISKTYVEHGKHGIAYRYDRKNGELIRKYNYVTNTILYDRDDRKTRKNR